MTLTVKQFILHQPEFDGFGYVLDFFYLRYVDVWWRTQWRDLLCDKLFSAAHGYRGADEKNIVLKLISEDFTHGDVGNI